MPPPHSLKHFLIDKPFVDRGKCCFDTNCVQRMLPGDIPVTIWLDAVSFSLSFATLVSLLSLKIFASGDVVCAVHEYGPSLIHEGHLTLTREQKVNLRFLRVWRTTSVTGNCFPHSAWITRCSLGAAAMQVGTVAPSERSCSRVFEGVRELTSLITTIRLYKVLLLLSPTTLRKLLFKSIRE